MMYQLNNAIVISMGMLMCLSTTQSFQSAPSFVPKTALARSYQPLLMSSFAADGSEYSAKDSDYEDEDAINVEKFGPGMDEDEDSEVKEESPVPMSKNTGNRFVALYWDQDVDIHGRDTLDLHLDRDELNEDHVMFCRKRNLYNETFNNDSMVDILKSLPL
jgi:hypothetical protein